MSETKKQKKVCRILSGKRIDECCEWLLNYDGNCICDVPGVTCEHSLDAKDAANIYKSFVFSYGGKTYDLKYENLRDCTFPDGEVLSSGDFFLRVDSQVVLHTSFNQKWEMHGAVDSILLSTVERAVLREWLEVIPRLVAKAKRIEEAETRQILKEASKKLDDNLDLGEYE